MGASIGWPFPKRYPCPEVAGSIPSDYTSFNQCLGGMCRPLTGPRVAIPFTKNKPCFIHQLVHMTTNTPAMCHTIFHISISMDYTDCTVNTFFFPVCHFEHNVISLSSNVYLNPNELRWVCDDEAYTPV
jgi:hypothetical protein